MFIIKDMKISRNLNLNREKNKGVSLVIFWKSKELNF